MVAVFGFKGHRPSNELVAKVSCPPYDVISSKEAREYAAGNPYSFLHVSKAEIDLDPATPQYDESIYQTAAKNMKKMLDDKIFVQDKERSIYIYKEIMGEQEQVGLMVCASVDDYDSGHIKKHELTRKDKEDDRAKHMDMISCHAGQVFLTYRAKPEIDALVAEKMARPADTDMVADGVRHLIWAITDQAWIDKIIELFKEVPDLYIADGHHRAASSSRTRKVRRERNPNHTGNEEYNRVMAVLFPSNQLKIMAYNRLILNTNGLSEADILAKLSEKFTISETTEEAPKAAHELDIYMGGKWYNLKAKEGIFDKNDPIDRLDVQIVQKNILDAIFDIKDPRTDNRIEFVGGIRGTKYLKDQVDSGHAKLAISMYPTSIDDLLSVADAGAIMPPKSTWFEPKLRSGLVIHTF